MSIIGYAQANFATLRADKNLYIDRTAYLHALENQSNRNLIFVRPRRFGKSLWLSMMYYYYGIEHKDQFETLFGDLDIGKNPTPLRNTYLVLRFQFAGINVDTDESTYRGFLYNVKTGVGSFMETYTDYFTSEETQIMDALPTPESVIQYLFRLCRKKKILFSIQKKR